MRTVKVAVRLVCNATLEVEIADGEDAATVVRELAGTQGRWTDYRVLAEAGRACSEGRGVLEIELV